jgi:hypothetical protein
MHATASLTMRDHALSLAHKGFRVFKLHPNSKVSCTTRFYEVASNDPVVVNNMWTDAYGNSLDNNIGVSTGDGLLVIDVDVKQGKKGEQSLATLVAMDLDTDTLTVKTPSGGRHLYYATSGPEFGSRVNKMGDGIDTRAHHGYVVGPGSVIDGRAYALANGAQVKPAPTWLEGWAAQGAYPRTRKAAGPLVDEDSESAVEQAAWWLVNAAPQAVEGEGGNHTTYRVACKMRDFGMSESGALDLMGEHWNDTKALPPWLPEELERIVANAYRYAQGEFGSESADAQFEAVEIKDKSIGKSTKSSKGGPTLVEGIDALEIPPRQWVMPGWLARKFVSGAIAPGALGKTQLMLALALSIVSGNKIPFGIAPVEQTAVWYWNQEDSEEELTRRLKAAMQHFGLSEADLGGRLYLDSGVEKPMMLVRKTMAGLKLSDDVGRIIQWVKDHGIGVFIFDPLVEMHEANENDNVEMRMVVAAARQIAVEANCAVMAVAHSRKPPAASSESYAGDVDSMRGAGAQANVMRIAHTLYGMSEKDALAWGVSAEERHLYVRTDLAKANLTAPDPRPRWWRRVSVPLVHLGGEQVGVLEPATLVLAVDKEPDLFEGIAMVIAANGLRGGEVGYERLSLEGCQVLGLKKNFVRTVTRAIQTVPGVTRVGRRKNDPDQWFVETRQGRLDIWVRQVKPWITFRLEETGGGAEEDGKETPVSVSKTPEEE